MAGVWQLMRGGVSIWVAVVLASSSGLAQIFEDDFERGDGPLSGWTVHAGEWNIAGGACVAGPAAAGTEQQAFIGDPPARMPDDFVLSFDMSFLAPADSQPVGRHAGCFFAWNQPGIRWDNGTTGYQLWWIDRNADRGLSLAVWEPGLRVLHAGTGDLFAAPPGNIRVEVEGDNIRVYGDDVLAIDVVDGSFRGGNIGLWTWGGAGNHVQFDNVEVGGELEPLDACFTFLPERPAAGAGVTFDASCSSANLGGTITSYGWNFGDGGTGTGVSAEHSYEFPDNYVVTLEIEDDLGNTATVEDVVGVAATLLPFEDDFDQDEGPVVDGWTVFSGDWSISPDGQLAGRSAGESHIYAGEPAGLISGDITAQFDIEFLNQPADGVGRHASVFLYAAEPISRWNTTSYSVWWIDRPGDFGMGLHRWTGGGLQELAVSKNTAPFLLEPPRTWTITVEGPRIRVYGDGALIIDVEDDQVPREGHFGFWTYSNGQDVLFDDVTVESGVFPPVVEEVVPCAKAELDTVLLGEAHSFDASCSQIPEGVNVTAYNWDFGDGNTSSGEVVEHTYEFEGVYVVELTVEHTAGPSVSTLLTVRVNAPAELPFSATFDQPPGPEVEGWTVFSGDWAISEEESLEVTAVGSEAHIWIGDPPIWFAGDLTMEFEIEFLNHNPPNDGVGKHAGFFFYSKEPISRWNSESYDVWWIDRDSDFGLGLHRWPLTFLSPGTFDLVPEPPTTWRVEVDGPTIRVFGDDEMFVEVDDDTRREGYIGFWAYSNDQRVRFDNLCIAEGPSEGSPDCQTGAPPPVFIRGDTNADGARNITDGVFVLSFLFDAGGGEPPCTDAADTNDDGSVNITDGVYMLNYLFSSGSEPPAPFLECGVDPTEDDLFQCAQFEPCGI